MLLLLISLCSFPQNHLEPIKMRLKWQIMLSSDSITFELYGLFFLKIGQKSAAALSP